MLFVFKGQDSDSLLSVVVQMADIGNHIVCCSTLCSPCLRHQYAYIFMPRTSSKPLNYFWVCPSWHYWWLESVKWEESRFLARGVHCLNMAAWRNGISPVKKVLFWHSQTCCGQILVDPAFYC